MFGKESYLTVLLRRYRCVACKRSFTPETPGLKPGRRSTEPLRQQLARLHHEGIPQSTLAGMNGISDASIERFYAEYNQRKAAERLTQQCPMVLGLDEHTLHKKQRFATTFCDLRNHKVFDVVAGKSEKELLPFLASLKGRERVKIVCIDLSSSYRSLIRKWFPNAKIVSDRFHVIRLIQHHFLALFRELVPSLADERGIFRLLRKKPKNLLPEQRLKLKALFLLHPVLKPVYDQMQKVRRLFSQKTKTKAQCRPLAHLFTRILEQLEDSLFQPMLTLAETLRSWAEPLARMWRFSKNNGITEGFHRKMKLIQRRAYGFRNFNNYRLRVVAHCG
jgi:transposase